MSPQLATHRESKFQHVRGYRSQLVYDALNLLHLLTPNEENEENFILSDSRDVSISNMTNCDIKNDSDDCNPTHSLGKSRILHQTFREHMRRRRMKRIFPKAIHWNKKKFNRMHPSNKFILKSIHEMCAVDSDWC